MLEIKKEVIKYAKKLNTENLSPLRSGNISMRGINDGVEGFFITPSGIKYEDLMSWEYYGEDWSITKPKVSFKQLPVLIIDDKHEIAQSIAILNYIEKIAGLDIKDQIQSAKADAILQSAQELFAPLNPTVNFAIGENFIEKRDTMKHILMSRFDDFDRAVNSGGKKFFHLHQKKSLIIQKRQKTSFQ